ncbi:MAG TPA: hypothetical protein VF381_03135 [Thermoanaerobaculia bacterium]
MFLPVILLALAVGGGADTGDLWVRFAPGAIVYLDGVQVSQTTFDENGSLLHEVKAGNHKVTVEVPNGGSATLDVNVVTGQLSTISISPLALHARPTPKGGIEVRAAADAKCVASVNDKQQPIGDPATFDDLAPGAYHVSVNCGTHGTAQGDVTVTDGRVAVLDTDLKSHRLSLLGDRSRVTRVALADPNKAIISAPLTAEVKRAIINGLSGGATIASISVPRPGLVIATVDCPNSGAAGTFFRRLSTSGGAVRSIQIESSVVNDNGSVRMVVGLVVATQ